MEETSRVFSNVANITSSTPNLTGTPKPNYDIPRYIYFYGLSIILPVGLICNLICFGVFLSSKSMRKTTTGHYLIALAVADTIFLLGELLRWLNTFVDDGFILDLNFVEVNLVWCQLTFYLRYAGKLASAWITVAIAGERFLTVAFPLKIARMSTTKIARTVIGLTYLCCFALGSYPFWTIGLVPSKTDNTTYCGYTNEKVYDKWSLAILRVGSLTLPSAIIFVFTILILHFLHTAKLRRAKLEIQLKNRSAKSMDSQLTIMLVGVAIAFLVLRLPYTISFYLNDKKEEIWKPLNGPIDPWFSYRIYYANKICDMIAISNYAVNFFLYCLCGSAFRSKFKKCITLKGGRKRVSSSIRTMSSRLTSSKHSKHSPPPPHRQ